MGPEILHAICEVAVSRILAHADELTTLDQAIGDGDHGINMRRGFEAIAAQMDELAALPTGQALQKAGMTLVMKVGGASGPLYGSLFMAMGKAMPADPVSREDFAASLAEGVEAVKKRGKSQAGEKTMLDVLVPVCDAMAAGPEDLLSAAREAAARGLESTRDMQATKGRASFLGERSVGHLDPGARSSALLIEAVCDVLGGQT